MSLPISPPFPPMEADTADRIPEEGGWQYEPKWDGFRCLAFRDGAKVELQSKSGQDLTRYFPEAAANLARLGAKEFVLDGELVIVEQGHLSFDDLLQRIHPAESRVKRLSAEHPATLIAFDVLVQERGHSLLETPLSDRREELEQFARRWFDGSASGVRLSPATRKISEARGWLTGMHGDVDGIMAKELDQPYRSGERAGMLKIKNHRTADCVVGGFRYGASGRGAGSLLLGLYDDAGKLNHVGFTSSFAAADKAGITRKVEALAGGSGFSGAAPGGPSRWNRGKATEWVPVDPKLVVEVEYDHFSGGRFRHGTRLLRWRPDKDPGQCTMRQVERESRSAVGLLV